MGVTVEQLASSFDPLVTRGCAHLGRGAECSVDTHHNMCYLRRAVLSYIWKQTRFTDPTGSRWPLRASLPSNLLRQARRATSKMLSQPAHRSGSLAPALTD